MTTALDHSSKQAEYRALTISMTVLGTVFVLLRFAARWRKRLSLGADDYLMILATVFLYGTMCLNLAMIHYGMGLHANTLPAKNLVIVAKLLMAFECAYCTCAGIIKISILLMYGRIFPTRYFRVSAYILGSIVIAWVIAIVCVSVFQCRPISKAWNNDLPGTCINLKDSFIGNAVPNIVTDILILALPVQIVWGLYATVLHRLSVISIFLLGSFVVFTSAYRFSTLFQFQTTDMTWTLSKACTWCLVECSSGIISACLPTLRPLVSMISNKFSSGMGSQRTRTTELKGSMNNNISLRPANELLSKQKIQAGCSQADDSSGDEVPLNTIRVQHDMTWQESHYAA
ncbi:hypothetical protein N7495_009089 [Penicillium taxi]|uniref:uncharacterized protein n=1 Tax=Penicillium taxi TaxID=168475 RepID=UPI0025452C1C|nr:uncharacterized protein N7495_009089 [Penicillium taxi]KAJ5889048.1 hypothetical protein N7495_009089 [Penicillium taxi]